MLNVKRYEELKAMSEAELRDLAASLGIAWPLSLGYASILDAEARLKDPEWARRLDQAFTGKGG